MCASRFDACKIVNVCFRLYTLVRVGSQCVVEINEHDKTVVLKQPGDAADGRKFTYDYVYGV